MAMLKCRLFGIAAKNWQINCNSSFYLYFLNTKRLSLLYSISYFSQEANVKRKESDWRSVIGIEVHAQIKSNSKLFSGAGTEFAALINNQVSYLDAALPGTLPVINKQCVKAGVLTGIALSCKIQKVSKFDRKHYFYADLPAGYQITQQRQPIAVDGSLEFMYPDRSELKNKSVKIERIQLEQDSGKSIHDPEEMHSLIDLNRAGVGLMEIITGPEFSSAAQVSSFVKELQLILQKIGTCDGKMEEGSLRVDANISVNKKGEPLGVRTEVKNLNSVRNVKKAIDYEIQRQIGIREKGEEVTNDTLSFDVYSGETVVMRDKEGIQDYRFMPEPNLPPLRLYDDTDVPDNPDGQIINIDELRRHIPELPEDQRQRLIQDYGISRAQAVVLMGEDGLLELFEGVVKNGKRDVKLVANIICVNILKELNEYDMYLSESPVTSESLGSLVDMYADGYITSKILKKVLSTMFANNGTDPYEIVKSKEWFQIRDRDQIISICKNVIETNEKAVMDFKRGKKKAYNALFGMVQKDTHGRADPSIVEEVLKEFLDDS